MLLHLRELMKALGLGALIFLLFTVTLGIERMLGAIYMAVLCFLGCYLSFLHSNYSSDRS